MSVIEVDFRRGRRDDPVEIARAAVDLAQVVVDRSSWLENQWEWERKRSTRLQRELLNERDRSFPYSDQDVVASLRRVYHGEPLAASEIAAGLSARPPTHSVCVRVGLALSRLATAGAVVQHRPDDPQGRITCRWEPAHA